MTSPLASALGSRRLAALGSLYVDPDALEPGDVILLSPRGLWAKLFRDALNTRFTHAELYVGNGHVVDARVTGVRLRPILRRRVGRFREFTIVRLSPAAVPDPEARRQVLARAVGAILLAPTGLRYSVRTVVKALARDRRHLRVIPPEAKELLDRLVEAPGAPGNVEPGPAGTFCSRLVAAAFESAGLELARPARDYLPGDFVVDPAFVNLHEELGRVWWRARPARYKRIPWQPGF